MDPFNGRDREEEVFAIIRQPDGVEAGGAESGGAEAGSEFDGSEFLNEDGDGMELDRRDEAHTSSESDDGSQNVGPSAETSAPSKTSKKRGYAKGMADDAHLPIEVVSAEGKPLEPRKNAIRFVHQCGVVVRDNVPISIQEWHKPAKVEGVSYVDNRLKDVLWDKLIAHFTLPVLDSIAKTNAMREKVKHFALKKMAEQFNKYKNRLYHDYVKDKKAPNFTGTLERQRAHWDSFLEYKNSEVAKQRSEKNKENAAKKKYHHKMGQLGYAGSEPKWDQAESNMRKKGITPTTAEWPRRARNWMLGHGAKYDMATGELIIDEKKETAIP